MPLTYYVPGIELKECPVSLITPESIQMVREIGAAMMVRDASGSMLFGPDAGKWDPRFYDAVQVWRSCEITAENARIDAEQKQS